MSDFPNVVQAGVVVISLFVGAVGSWFSFENRVSNLEKNYQQLPIITERLTEAVEELTIAVTKLEVKQEYLEKERGH